jgi:hypothetical protein
MVYAWAVVIFLFVLMSMDAPLTLLSFMLTELTLILHLAAMGTSLWLTAGLFVFRSEERRLEIRHQARQLSRGRQ